MELLNIFHTGGLTLGLTIVFAFLEIMCITQAVKHSRVEGYSLFKSPFIWGAIIVLAFYVFALLKVASDYKGI